MKSHFLTILSAILLFSCDDGSIEDKMYTDNTAGYSVEITGEFSGQDTWDGTSYNIVVAGFDDESEYSVIQKTIPENTEEEGSTTVTLANVNTSARTIEIAAVTSLRTRIATFYSYTIPTGQHVDEPIRIDVGKLDVSMFQAINKSVFNGSSLNCARCHSSNRAAGGLDLSSANCLSNLINTPSQHDPSQIRVFPGNAEESFLYKVITDGGGLSYTHPALFTEESRAPLVKLIKTWIEGQN